MTIEEAILHCKDRAKTDYSECADEHKQLAEWLTRLSAYENTGMNQKRILRMIDREKYFIELLSSKDLSCHGYWDMGYHQGRLSVLEYMADAWMQLPEPHNTGTGCGKGEREDGDNKTD